MTFDDFINIGRLRSKLDAYKLKTKQAIDICCECLEKFNSPYIALSGGKDSVAMAFIVKEASRIVAKSVRLWSHISDASFPGTIETCKSVSERTGFPLDVFRSEESAYKKVQERKKQSFGKSGVFFDSIREYAVDKDLAFVGVRAYESKRRMNAAKIHGQVFCSKSMGDVTVCHPLLWFKLEDVAALLYEYDAPIHPIYKKMQIERGQNSFHEDMFIRLGYITSKDLLNKGTAVFLKVNYPNKFNDLAKVYPEIRLWV